jgi:hypothetical protein
MTDPSGRLLIYLCALFSSGKFQVKIFFLVSRSFATGRVVSFITFMVITAATGRVVSFITFMVIARRE